MRIVGVIQARMGSSRFPGKVMKPVAGAPMLARMLQRVRAAQQLDQVVVATTWEAKDEPIRDLCLSLDVPCVSGHPFDLLERHLQAGQALEAEVVVKIPSDCPLIDPLIIDRVVEYYRQEHRSFDFVSNLHPATYPDGNDVEVIPMSMLELASREATLPHEREHTTPFFWDRPDRFRIGNVEWESGLNYAMSHRFTVDYAEDYEFVQAVFEALLPSHEATFSMGTILSLLGRHPELFAINSHLAGVNWYRNHLSQLRTISRRETICFQEEP